MPKPRTYAFWGFALMAVLSCSKSLKDVAGYKGPKPGSKRSFTVPISYYVRDYSTAASADWATYPVAAFPADSNAVRYNVKFHSFKTRTVAEGQQLSWAPGQLPPSGYHPRPDLGDLIGNTYHVAYSATWCKGNAGSNCSQARMQEYREFYETNFGGLADITIEY